MRPKFNRQAQFDFQPSPLKVTNEYYQRYEAISKILDENPEMVEAVHADIQEPLAEEVDPTGGTAQYHCCSETLLRIILCQIIERCSLRRIIIRIDDSHFLRLFVRMYNDPMIDFTTFARLRNRIQPQTWKRIHEVLNRWAVKTSRISGQRLRLDTTAVETNVHWPTDSSLLWDSYRVLARLLRRLRKRERVLRDRRLHPRRVRRLYLNISRRARGQVSSSEALKPLYSKLIQQVTTINALVDKALKHLKGRNIKDPALLKIIGGMGHYRALSERVVDQARRRTMEGETVPNAQKLFSIFEPHTELLKRGKTVRNIEFGHMIQIQQVEEKFITGYEVFPTKPNEALQLAPALEQHKTLFGAYPLEASADKGYAQSSDQLAALSRKVKNLAVGKAGRLSETERDREHTLRFRLGQSFRAGVEGTISYLKRALGLARCLAKNWPHYAAAVGASLLAHNLLILARG